jgi:hypothetical protein
METAAGIFGVAAVVLGIVSFFFVPFASAPVGVVCLVIAIMLSPRYQGLYQLAAVLLIFGVVIGGGIAAAYENPLY